jgi:hypothetical protein
VNKEIEDFKALGREKYILALILDGEPNATGNSQSDSANECFPPALQYPAEPLAGDLRKEGDGKERGFLKVLAGIAQLDFDVLYRRHERAQQKKRLTMGGAALCIIGLLAGLAVFAFAQKQEAERQEQEAIVQRDLVKAEKERQDELLWKASRADHEAALRAKTEGNRSETAAYLIRALQYKPENSAALNESIRLSSGSESLVLMPRSIHKFKSPVSSVCFSPDGSRVAAASRDKTVRVLDASTGNEISRVELGSVVNSVCFSPDGTRVAAGSGSESGAVSVFETSTGNEISRREYERGVTRVCFSPDGSRMAAGSYDNSVQVFEARRIIEELASLEWLNWLKLKFGCEFDATGQFTLVSESQHTEISKSFFEYLESSSASSNQSSELDQVLSWLNVPLEQRRASV